jgi:OOP family OmpA-OmpF porin
LLADEKSAMKMIRRLSLMLGLAALTACATPWEVAEVQEVETTMTATGGTAFTKALFEEYREQARYEAEVEYEWSHAVIFARKAARAAVGEVVAPEDPATWEIPASALPALTAAHTTLLGHLADGARDRVPAAAAKAQAALDCWIEEEWESDTDSTCKDSFLATEKLLRKPVVVLAPEPTLANTYVVYFDLNQSAVSPEAEVVIHQAATNFASVPLDGVHIDGYADTVGSRTYNMKLSLKRAQEVAKALTLAGLSVPPPVITGYGKDHLAVQTGDNVLEPKNRRVEIIFQPAPKKAAPVTSAAPAPQPEMGSGSSSLSFAMPALPVAADADQAGSSDAGEAMPSFF